MGNSAICTKVFIFFGLTIFFAGIIIATSFGQRIRTAGTQDFIGEVRETSFTNAYAAFMMNVELNGNMVPT